MGLRDGELEHLFESFYTTKAGGIGMSPAICRSIAETHGGRIDTGAESLPVRCFASPSLSNGMIVRVQQLSAPKTAGLKPAAAGAICGGVCAAGHAAANSSCFPVSPALCCPPRRAGPG
ncbi:hypothetical protein [Paraburkholderia sp. WSM4175]|uniref:hypothetical protein n=1 Tax=Paraburkholderia sp. WSM4175 TaxID=2991072 RepID=UPI003D219A27